jgi:hypothetical protein
VAQLTSLTRLHVDVFHEEEGEDWKALHGVLRQLDGLAVVGTHSWMINFLPLLQSLTVTAVYGSWLLDPTTDFSGLACAHVRELGEAANAPF